MFPARIPGLNVELKLSGPLKTDVDVVAVVNPPDIVTAPAMFAVLVKLAVAANTFVVVRAFEA
jgi:hypothetical protein